jgi:radical SAM protein with 4Fe4S-binding SPASM domain
MITSEYSGPKKLEFELPFGKCKNKCKFCSNYGGETVAPPLTQEEAFKVVSDFIEIGGDTLVVTGGEPLECPFCWELIRYSKNEGLRVYVYSAGYLVNKEVAKRFRSMGIDRIYVTILGSEEIHDWITEVSGSYKLSITAIDIFVREELYTGINFIPMKPNWHKWKHVFQTVAELGVNEFRITELMPQGRAWDNRDLLELNLSQYSEMLGNMSEQLPPLLTTSQVKIVSEGICFGFLINDQLFPLPTCSAGKTGLTITPEGFMIPCLGCRTKLGSRTPDKKYILAKYSLVPFNMMRKIWYESEILQDFRELSIEDIGGLCKECKELKKCRGGCPIRREIETGNIKIGPDFKCILKNQLEANRDRLKL